MTISFQDVERIRLVFATFQPGATFPYASYKGAVRELGGDNEVAEGLLAFYKPDISRCLRRLPATNPDLFWSSDRLNCPAFFNGQALAEQVFGMILAEAGGVPSRDPAVLVAIIRDCLKRLWRLKYPRGWSYYDGMGWRQIPLIQGKPMPKRRHFDLDDLANRAGVLEVLTRCPPPLVDAVA